MTLRRIGTVVIFSILAVIAATAATLVQYGSLHPCTWLRVDAAEESRLPAPLVETRLRALFLLRGVTDPGPSDCITEWWRVRRRGLPEIDPS